MERPATAEEIAALLAEGRRVRPVGGGTKLDWGALGPAPEIEISPRGLDALVEHSEGDLTAVLQAGLPLARAQETFAEKGQRLCLDPPDGDGLATGSSPWMPGDAALIFAATSVSPTRTPWTETNVPLTRPASGTLCPSSLISVPSVTRIASLR